MPHLLLISTSYPQHSDGSEAAGAFVHDFAIALSQYCKVTVLAPSHSSHILTISDTLRIVYFQVPQLPLSLLKAHNPTHWLAILKTLNAGSNAVHKLVASNNFDHTLAFWALPSGYWAQKATKVPYTTWALGSDIWTLSRIPFIRQLLIKILKASQSNFADGYELQKQVEILTSKQCHFLPSTREIGLTQPKVLTAKPPYKLAFLGRWHPNKGVDILLDSLALLGKKDWQLISEIRIAGGGPLSRVVNEKVTQLQKNGHPIQLLGFLDKDDAIDLLTWADYLLIPSRIESIPVIFSDAMKCHCPVAVTPVGDMPRLLSEYNVGELATDVSPSAFTKTIRKLLHSTPCQYENGLRQSAEIFSVKHSVEKLLRKLDLFDE